MKRIIIILTAALMGTFSSCTNWLEHTPYDQVPGDELYATEAGVQEALNGLYLGLLNRNLWGQYRNRGCRFGAGIFSL